MDVELREALTQGFGAEPPHRQVTERLEAGHRALRRRRVASAALTVAVATAVGIGVTALAGGGPDRSGQVATDPTTSAAPTPEPWADGELVRYSASGLVEVRPEVTVLHQIDEPLGDPSEFNHSVALALEFDGVESWLILDWRADPDGGTSEMAAAGIPTGGSFAHWVEQQVAANEDDSGGVVHFAVDGRLVSTHGVEILDQVLDPPLKDFVLNGEPSAAALLQGPDGKKWYVLVRDIDGLETISTPFRTGGADLEEFLDYAREKYASGEGLR